MRQIQRTAGVTMLAFGVCLAFAAGVDAAETIVADSALLRVVEQVATPARTAGVLASIQVEKGDVVREGRLLGMVDESEATLIHERATIELELSRHKAKNEVAIRAAERAVAFAGDELQRLRQAATALPGSISASELAESEAAADQAEFDLEQARHDHETDSINLRMKQVEQAVAARTKEIHRIVAPISGVVVEVLRRRGEWVEPGEDVIRIMRIDRLRAEGLVPLDEISFGLVGAEAKISARTPWRGEVTATGRVVFVDREINPVNNRVRVRAEFENPGEQLLPGMRVRMTITPRPTEPPVEVGADARQ